jgi:peptide/nickel transport system ATP-binding protein
LDDVSLNVEKGRVIGLTGESGSGKTTMARIALRLTNPSSGSILLDGMEITHMSMKKLRPLRRHIQIVFQHPEGALDPEFRLRESIQEALLRSGVTRALLKERMEEACAEVDMPLELLDRYPSQVSGGEIQRAALARVLSFQPDYLFLDEPTSMLDVSVQAFILNLIKNRAIRDGMGVVLITHDIDIIRCMCSDVTVLSRGKIVDRGPAESILTAGGHSYTRELIRTWDAQKSMLGSLE